MNDQIRTSQTRPFSLGIYLLIVFGLSWPFQFASAIWGGPDLLTIFVLNGTAMIMVTVGTYICGRYIFRDGFAGDGWNWGKPKYYLAVIGLAALLWIVPECIDLVAGTLKLPVHISPVQVIWVFVLLFVGLIPGFGEEFGWRGYMLPRLAQHMNTRRAVLLHSLIWWSWHLPLLVGGAVALGIAGAKTTHLSVGLSITVTVAAVVVLGIIPTICHGIVFAYIWTRAQSLAVSSVYHAAYDGMRDSLTLTIGLGPIAGVWANVLLLILGVALLWKGDWSNLKAFSQQTTSESTVPTPQPARLPTA